MQKLKFQTIKLKGKIITPIHIWSGDVYDRLGYIVSQTIFDSITDNLNKLLLLNEEWLKVCAEKEREIFDEIILAIKNGDFIKLEELKLKFFKDYFDKSWIVEEIGISQGALNYLLMKGRDYSNHKDGIKGNQGEIKKFIKSKFGKEIIPGSTLKGLIKSIILQSKKSKNGNYIEEAKKLENLLKGEFKFQSAFFEINDVELKNFKKQIQFLQLNVKDSKSGIPLVFETITEGEFEFEILYDTNIADFLNNFEKLLSAYSLVMIEREQRVFGNRKYLSDFLNKLDDYLLENIFPVKIGMYKKSLTYKVYWEEILDDVYQKLVNFFEKVNKRFVKDSEIESFYFTNNLKEFGFKKVEDFKKWVFKNKNKKSTQVVGQKLGVGDRSFYIAEDGLPVGWITLEIVN